MVASVHIGGSDILLAAGVIFGLLALTARGPLGLLRACGPRLHATLDVAAGLLLALSPLVRPLRPGVAGIVIIEFVAVAWLRISTLTRYTVRAGVSEPTAASPGASATTALGQEGPPSAEMPSTPTLSAVRQLGRLTAGARSRLPDPQTTLDTGARRVGSHAGRLHRAWRRATR